MEKVKAIGFPRKEIIPQLPNASKPFAYQKSENSSGATWYHPPYLSLPPTLPLGSFLQASLLAKHLAQRIVFLHLFLHDIHLLQ
jgi:hypothetical protein